MRMLRLLPHLSLLLALSLLAACAKQPAIPVDSGEAAAVWERFVSLPESTTPYRLNMSLRYGPENDTRRVTALMWGNGTGPVRLDVSAGMGALVARLAENGQDFVAVSPRENKAWVHKGTDPFDNNPRVLINFGLPLPLGLTHMSELLQGNFQRVFGSELGRNPVRSESGILYTLTGRFGGQLLLSPDGLPLRWSDSKAWAMDLAYDAAAPTQPDKITLIHADGQQAIILVKTREVPNKPYTERQLSLEVPVNAEVRVIQGSQR